MIPEFRAWDKQQKKMLQLKGFTQNTNTVWYTLYFDSGFTSVRIPQDAILMQYTGFKDKKRTKEYPDGQKIFEGDICEVEYADGRKVKAVVEFNDGCFDLHFQEAVNCNKYRDYLKCHTINHTVKVIGNIHIHQNPELIK